jgi:hypothetical protein
MVFFRLLELAAGHEPVRYRELLATHRPDSPARQPRPPSQPGPPPGRPPMAHSAPNRLRLNGYPYTCFAVTAELFAELGHALHRS